MQRAIPFGVGRAGLSPQSLRRPPRPLQPQANFCHVLEGLRLTLTGDIVLSQRKGCTLKAHIFHGLSMQTPHFLGMR